MGTWLAASVVLGIVRASVSSPATSEANTGGTNDDSTSGVGSCLTFEGRVTGCDSTDAYWLITRQVSRVDICDGEEEAFTDSAEVVYCARRL